MAKKLGTISQTVSLDNLKKAGEALSSAPAVPVVPVTEQKSYIISFLCSQSLHKKIRDFQLKFLYNTKNLQYELFGDFFRMMLQEIIEYHQIGEIDDVVLSFINKRGRRKQYFRAYNDIIAINFGQYNDNTIDLFNRVMCYYGKKHMEYYKEFSKGFFIEDIVNFMEKNLDEIIKKYTL